MLKKGTQIDEFEVIGHLGSGAAGDVYLTTARADIPRTVARGRRYALKLYNDWALSQFQQDERIKREFEIATGISHPNVVQTFLLRRSSGNPPRTYLVMEALVGETLFERINGQGRLSVEELRFLLPQLASAVHKLHRQKVIHRDIKPQNIFLDQDGRLKLLDLGVARDETAETMTPSDQFLGTLRYAAPEMLFSGDYDNNVDLYGVGATLHFMMTGVEPFAVTRASPTWC